jgi:DNA phosphorothioation-associated putative methyltransferase
VGNHSPPPHRGPARLPRPGTLPQTPGAGSAAPHPATRHAPSSAPTPGPAARPTNYCSAPAPGRPSTRRAGAPVGKLLPDDLYVHKSALEHLEPLLRIYEGCGRAYLGEIEGTNLIKIHRRTGKISYLCYPDFDTDPHPALLRCVKLSLRTRELACFDYTRHANVPVLHRKETFLAPEHPLHAKFARLSEQEERHGLLAEPAPIGTRDGWEARLCEAGFRLRGHRLVKCKGE